MALYWPNEKVALDIVDDPHRRPFEGDESYTVLRVTCQDLNDYDSYRKVATRLCELLGREVPTGPDLEERSFALHSMLMHTMLEAGDNYLEDEFLDEGCYATRAYDPFCCDHTDMQGKDDKSDHEVYLPASVCILATTAEEGDLMREAAQRDGHTVSDVSVWHGPVPHGSFERIGDGMRMSTPEYFFLRKANELPFPVAVSMGIELCGKYRTKLTQYSRTDGYDFLKTTRTSTGHIRRYLRGARGTKEGKHAKKILKHVVDKCGSPMGCFLYIVLCLPTSHGSYGLERAILTGAFSGRQDFLPSSEGDYLAYDLCWPHKHVALQYTGSHQPTQTELEALQTENMSVLCVTDADVADSQRFDYLARTLAGLLDTNPPERTPKWIAAQKRLFEQVPKPTFDHMRLTYDEISEHIAA